MRRHRVAADQPSLDLWPRQHDLPARWDGHPVQWSQWSDTATVFACPPPKPQPCTRCGSVAASRVNIGRVWTDPSSAPPAISRGRLRGGRHLVGVITAFRCPDCGQDQVLDSCGTTWDLDETDYCADGSWDQTRGR
jgi:hypothetical protein